MEEKHECHELVGLLSDYVEGELSPELCEELQAHLENCPNCRIVVNTFRKTIELYHDASEMEAMPGEVRERLYHRLNLDDFLK